MRITPRVCTSVLSFYWKLAVKQDGGVLKCVIVHLARDIAPFIMYCVNRESGLSLLIESTIDD